MNHAHHVQRAALASPPQSDCERGRVPRRDLVGMILHDATPQKPLGREIEFTRNTRRRAVMLAAPSSSSGDRLRAMAPRLLQVRFEGRRS